MKKIRIALLLLSLFTFLAFLPVSAEEVEDSKEINTERAGSYFVEIVASDGDEVLRKKVRIDIVFPKTILSDLNQEGIDAHDIRVKKEETQTLSNQQLIDLAGAHAWSLIDGTEVPITTVEIISTENKSLYEILFSTEKGTTVSVYCYELNEQGLGLATMYYQPSDSLSMNYTMIGLEVLLIVFIPLILIILLYLHLQQKMSKVNALLFKE